MSNFGLFDLRLVAPYDLAFREAVSAVNAEHVLRDARVFPSLPGALADCRLVAGATGLEHRQPSLPVHSLEKAGRLIRRASGEGPVALVFGSEKHGLANEHFMHCHWLLRIPTRPEHESMNLGQAVAVCLYELARRPARARETDRLEPAASGGELQRLHILLEEILQRAGYKDFGALPSATEKIHQLLRRLDLRGKDPAIWTGILRQILWRLKNPGSAVE